MTDAPDPWSSFPPELWQRLLAVAFIESPFDPSDVALDAGLTEDQTRAFEAWCAHVDFEDDLRRQISRMSPADRRFIQSLGLEPAPDVPAENASPSRRAKKPVRD